MEIHQFSIGDTRLALDVPTGKCLEVDNIADAVLTRLARTDDEEQALWALSAQYPVADLRVALQEIRDLKGHGLFLSDSNYLDVHQSYSITCLTLNVSHACNLACTYCFAGQGNYGGETAHMENATARRAIDLLMEMSRDQPRIAIWFFGGEPLLNVPAIKDALAYARERSHSYNKNVSFSMTTNGLLLSDDLIEYFAENKVGILISIDGGKDVQDLQRPLRDGKGSYEKLVPWIRALSDRRGGRLSARATVTTHNVQISKVINDLSAIGFGRVFCTPVFSTCPSPLALGKAHIEQLEAEYERMAQELLNAIRGRKAYPFGGFMRRLQDIHLARKRIYGCGVGRTMMTVTPSGDVFPCHRFVGMQQFRMGNIWNGFDAAAMQEKFTAASVLSLPGCQKCWARYLCAGNCLHAHAKEDGSFGKSDPLICRLYKKEIELSLFLYAKIKEEHPEVLHQSSHTTALSNGA